MANILFVNANLYGHINPTLPLVRELVKRGNKVDYFCSKQFEEKVIAEGAVFLNYSTELDEFLAAYRPTDRHPFFLLMEYILLYAEAVLPGVLELIHRKEYDMVVCDSLFGAPYFLDQLIQIPVVSSHSSFAMSHAPVPDSMLQPGTHPQLDHCYEILNRICDKYKVPVPGLSDIFISKSQWNVVYTIPEFNGDAGLEASKYFFTGALVEKVVAEPMDDIPQKDSRPLIYISLGSVNTDFIDFYKMCLEAFKASDVFVMMSIGKKCKIEQLGDIPSNFYVGNFLPQLAILEQADVFITHAGFNSVNEALSYSVPMYAFPMVNDQHMVAKRLNDLKLGIVGQFKEISPQSLREGTEQLLREKEYKENCIRISKQLKGTEGLILVAEKLEEVCLKR